MSQALSALSVGSLLKFGAYQVEGSSTLPIVFKIIGQNHTGYPANSTTLLANQIIDLRGFDAKEPSNADANRQNYGNNRYLSSNLRQWLNDGGAASAWWAAMNPADGAANTNNHDATPADAGMSQPTGYNDIKGFLGNFIAAELAKILDTTLTVARNTVTDTGATSETVVDKIFLLSNTEIGLANENSIAEGTLFAPFDSDAHRIATATAQLAANTLSTSKPASGAAWYWWLRTPYAGYSYHARFVSTGGTLDYDNAYGGNYGVRPALNLDSGILVSDSVDGDGCYTAIWNATPTINGSDAALGNKSASFTQTFTVNDTDAGDTLTVTEKVDTTTLATITPATRNQTYEIDLADSWADLALGAHSISIVVDDGVGGEATRTYTWAKVDDRLEFVLTSPIQTSEAARKIVISAILTVPAGATLTIKACNNGLDATPTWEDVTAEYTAKEAYVFTNATKTDANWAVNVWFQVLRGTATTALEAKSFGFSFE